MIAQGVFTFAHCSLSFKVPDTKVPSPASMSSKSLREHMENKDFEMYSIVDMWSYREVLQNAASGSAENSDPVATAKLINVMTYGMHDKIATPLICLALVLVGVLARQRAMCAALVVTRTPAAGTTS